MAFVHHLAAGSLAVVFVATTFGCATKSVWSWATRTRFEVTASTVNCLGARVLEEAGIAQVDFEVSRGRPPESALLRVDVPIEWDRIIVVGERSGGARCSPLRTPYTVDAEPEAPFDADVYRLESAVFDPGARHPLSYFVNRDGVASVYAWDETAARRVLVSRFETAETIAVPPSPFQYVLATAATPPAVAVDAVGLVFYVALWPVWASVGIGYDTDPPPSS